MKPRTPAEVPVEKDLGYASLSTPRVSPASSDGPTASSLSPPSPLADPAAGTPPRAHSKGKGGPSPHSIYLTVLLDNHDLHGRPDGTRKQVEAKLIRRNPSTVVVELPDGRMVKRKIQRDVVGGL